MNVVSLIFLIVSAGLVLWLIIDTTIWAVRKSKAKKQVKKDDQTISE